MTSKTIFLLLAVILFASLCAGENFEIGFVEKAKGEAKTLRDGEFELLKRGDIILQNEKISALGNGYMKLKFIDNDGSLTLGGESDAIVSMFPGEEKNEKVVSLLKGSLLAGVLKSMMRIEAQDAVIDFDSALVYAYSCKDTVRVICLEGACRIMNGYGEAKISAGESGLILADATPYKLGGVTEEFDMSQIENENESIEIQMKNQSGEERIIVIEVR
ncbi:MAG: hypothetical protein PHW02_07325 [bacterium]|nr:hypothetical protein [bacterium]